MSLMVDKPRADKLIVHVSRAVGEEMRSLARSNERSVSAELRVALRHHLAGARNDSRYGAELI
jgi:hypothetical protein